MSLTPDPLPHLDGLTYQDTLGQFVPRFPLADKPRGHVSTYTLSIYYGLQDEEATGTTTIAFGLLPEGFANFGFLGMVLLGIFSAARSSGSSSRRATARFSPTPAWRLSCSPPGVFRPSSRSASGSRRSRKRWSRCWGSSMSSAAHAAWLDERSRSAPPRAARLAIVVSHPTQYYSPCFARLPPTAPPRCACFYLWDFGVVERHDPQFGHRFAWDVDLLGGYAHEFVPNVSRDPGTHRFRGLRNPGLPARLEAWRPDALLLFGYNYATHLRTILWARRRDISLLFRGDSHFIGRPVPRAFRRALLWLLYRQFAAITYVGQANRAYFRALGVPETRLFFAPHAVDATLFDPCQPAHRDAAAALRSILGLDPATCVVLYAGKRPGETARELLQHSWRCARGTLPCICG